MEIKKREVLFSIVIICLMVVIGNALSDFIFQGLILRAEEFSTSTIITDKDQFSYAMSTDFGSSLVYGDVTTTSPVTYDEIGEKYIYIEKVKQHYTMHTKTVTKKVGKKKITETKTYYTWDRVSSDNKMSETIMFLGVEFNSDILKLPTHRLDLDSIDVDNRGNYIYETSKDRYYYIVTDLKLTGTVKADLKNNTMNISSSFYNNQTPEQVKEMVKNDVSFAITLFWVIWIVLIVAVLIGFFYLENRWLD